MDWIVVAGRNPKLRLFLAGSRVYFRVLELHFSPDIALFLGFSFLVLWMLIFVSASVVSLSIENSKTLVAETERDSNEIADSARFCRFSAHAYSNQVLDLALWFLFISSVVILNCIDGVPCVNGLFFISFFGHMRLYFVGSAEILLDLPSETVAARCDVKNSDGRAHCEVADGLRYDLVIRGNGKTEKIASGLLDPFLCHLKTAKDQIAKGGYSITLEVEPGNDATWFTKGTVERFVRFVSTPEVLERVNTIESEILQIDDAIAIQSNENFGCSSVEVHQTRSIDSVGGSKPLLDADADKAIVLFKPGVHQPESNGSTTHEENSKVQLLKVLETRKTVLQKEQGMAFARAVAAGFDMDHLTYLILFAECFGATRLMDACLNFVELWKRKHETGQWVEVGAADATSGKSDFSSINPSAIMLSGEAPGPLGTESNGKMTTDAGADTNSQYLSLDQSKVFNVSSYQKHYVQLFLQFCMATYTTVKENLQIPHKWVE
ncbi:hypothetical protein ACLOJK_011431 [Asimina triloba]